MRRPSWFFRQSGAIPVRFREGAWQVLLITSRNKGKWIIPKGIIQPSMTPAASAAQEAWEEAGVVGYLHPEPVGRYCYDKWGGTCTVEVFLLEVEQIESVWPEGESRKREWYSWEEALQKVEQEALRKVLRDAAGELDDRRRRMVLDEPRAEGT